MKVISCTKKSRISSPASGKKQCLLAFFRETHHAVFALEASPPLKYLLLLSTSSSSSSSFAIIIITGASVQTHTGWKFIVFTIDAGTPYTFLSNTTQHTIRNVTDLRCHLGAHYFADSVSVIDVAVATRILALLPAHRWL